MKSIICTKCNIVKDTSEFHLRTKRKKGVSSRCKQCTSNDRKLINFEAQTVGVKICTDCKLEKSILLFFRIKIFKDGRDTRCKYCENKRKLKILKNNPRIRITENLRKRTRDVLKGISKSKSTLSLIGCSKLEQEKCFHYSNLQPLWATDNRKKANKYDQ